MTRQRSARSETWPRDTSKHGLRRLNATRAVQLVVALLALAAPQLRMWATVCAWMVYNERGQVRARD